MSNANTDTKSESTSTPTQKRPGRPTLLAQQQKAVAEAVDNSQCRAQVLAQLVASRYASIGYAQISPSNWKDIAECADKIIELAQKRGYRG